MRYFLDTEFNGFGGDLLSLALVPEDGDQDYYVVIPFEGAWHPWVEKHVVPYLESVPPMLLNRLDRVAAAHDVAAYLANDPDPVIVADWPEDIALFCRLLLVGRPRSSTSATCGSNSTAPRVSRPRATAGCRTTRCTMPAR